MTKPNHCPTCGAFPVNLPAGGDTVTALVAEIEAYGRDCIFHGTLVDHSGVVAAAQRMEQAADAKVRALRAEIRHHGDGT